MLRNFLHNEILWTFFIQDGRDPLSWACSKGLHDIVQMMLKNGATVNRKDEVSYNNFLKKSRKLKFFEKCNTDVYGMCSLVYISLYVTPINFVSVKHCTVLFLLVNCGQLYKTSNLVPFCRI